MGKSLPNHEMLIPGHLKRWEDSAHVAKFLRDVGYTDVTGIWSDTDRAGKLQSSPHPDGLKIAAQRGMRDMVSGDERAKRIRSRIRFACEFTELKGGDVRADRIGSKKAPSRALLIEKSKAVGLPDEWIYSGENPWFPPRPTFISDTPTRGKIGDVHKFIQSYVSLVSSADLALRTMYGISERCMVDTVSDEEIKDWDFKYYYRLKTIRGYGLILAAAKEHTHPWTEVIRIQKYMTKEVKEAATSVSKWLPFFGLFEKEDLAIVGNNDGVTFTIPLTAGDLSTATNAMGYLLDLIKSNRVTDLKDFAPAIRQTRDKIASAFRFDKLDDSMLGKHNRKKPNKT